MKTVTFWSTVVFIFTLSTSIIAQPGTLDQSFGQDGGFQLDVNSSQDRLNDLAVFSNGDMVGVGVTNANGEEEYIIVGITADGNINTNFGNEGIIIGFNVPEGISRAVGVSIYGDKVYALISIFNNSSSFYQILKFNASGEIDTTFADNGSFFYDFDSNNFSPNDIYADPDGNIYSSAERGRLVSLIKLNENGILDTTFGNGGVLIIDQENRFERAIGISTQTDGKILMTGELNDPAFDWNLNVFRITTEGSLDTEFSRDGYIIENIRTGNTETGQDIIQLRDGSIMVTGGAHDGNRNQALFIKYMANGDRNSAFGDNGVVLVETQSNSPMTDVAEDDRDRIVAAGEDVILRLNSDGSLDTSFGYQGIVKDNLYSITTMMMDEEGYILVAGSYWGGENNDLIIRKYRSESSTSVDDGNQLLTSSVKVFPNPSDEKVNLEYTLEKTTDVTIELYDVNGRKISQLLQMEQYKGIHELSLNLEKYNLSDQIFFIRLKTNQGSRMIKLLRLQ